MGSLCCCFCLFLSCFPFLDSVLFLGVFHKFHFPSTLVSHSYLKKINSTLILFIFKGFFFLFAFSSLNVSSVLISLVQSHVSEILMKGFVFTVSSPLSIFFPLFIYFNPQASRDPSLSGPNWDWGHPVVDWKLCVKAQSLFPVRLHSQVIWLPCSFSLGLLRFYPLNCLPFSCVGPAPRGLEGLQGVWVTQVPGPSPNSCFYYSDPTRCQLCCVPRPQNTSDSTSLESKPLVFGCFWNTVLTGLAVFSLTFALPFRDSRYCQFLTCSELLWGKSLCSLVSTSASIDCSRLWPKRSAAFPPFAFPLPRVSDCFSVPALYVATVYVFSCHLVGIKERTDVNACVKSYFSQDGPQCFFSSTGV